MLKNFAITAAASALLIAGCSTLAPAPVIDPLSQPEAIRVPSGNVPALLLVGKGEITYECRAKADTTDQFAWAFVAPNAALVTSAGLPAGRYYAGPTWEALDGSRVTGKQVAIAPATPGNIPLQLVKTNPAGSWSRPKPPAARQP